MSRETGKLTKRERLGLRILLFALRIVNPTGYTHEIKPLIEELESEL